MPRLRCYDPSVGGGGGIHGWYNGLSPGFRAQVDAVLELLALEDDLDAVPEVKAMRGALRGPDRDRNRFLCRATKGLSPHPRLYRSRS
jgi:hypothetical protein